MSADKERISKLWVEDETPQEKHGELFETRAKLSDAFDSAATLPSLPPEFKEHNGSLISPVTTLRVRTTPYSVLEEKKSYNYNLKALKTETQDIFIAIEEKPEHKDDEVENEIHEYIINFNGTVVKTSELEPGVQPSVSDDEQAFVKKASNTIADSIIEEVNYQKRSIARDAEFQTEIKRERTRKVVRGLSWVTGTAVVLSGAAVGGYYAWSKYVDEPAKAENARRLAYDAEKHTIDSQTIELDDQRLLVIPSDEFSEIPSFRSGDSLESPRTIEVDGEFCATVTVDDLEDKDLKIGVSDYNPIGEYPVIAYATDNQLNICFTDKPDEAPTGDDAKIAIQLVESND